MSLLPRANDASTTGYTASISIPAIIATIEEIRNITIALTVLIVLSVLLRMYVRLGLVKRFDPSDWAMVATFLFAMAHNGTSIYNASVTHRIWSGQVELIGEYKTVLRVSGVFYTLSLKALKISLGYFFLNIFSHMKIQKMMIWTVMAISTTVGVVYVAVGNLTCAQIKAIPGLETTCPTAVQTAATVLFVIFSIITIVGDFAFALMGIFALWGATMPLPTKLSACILLALGSIGGVASTVRLAVVLEPTNFAKYTQQSFTLLRWVLIEIALGIIAANLAMVRILFQRVLARVGILSSAGETTKAGVPATVGSGGRRTRNDPLTGDVEDELHFVTEIRVEVDAEKGIEELRVVERSGKP